MTAAVSSFGIHQGRVDRVPKPAAEGAGRTTKTVRYCTRCGGTLALKWLDLERCERRVCIACGEIHYENPRLLVSCYVHWLGRVVFCRRARAPAKGLWALPAGFVEQGETLEQAVVREIHEEIGLSLTPSFVSLFRLVSLPHINEVYVEFRAELKAAPAFSPGPEALEVALFSERDIPREHLAFADIIPSYPDEFFECLRSGDFPIRSLTLHPLKAI